VDEEIEEEKKKQHRSMTAIMFGPEVKKGEMEEIEVKTMEEELDNDETTAPNWMGNDETQIQKRLLTSRKSVARQVVTTNINKLKKEHFFVEK
jgi:hypothetical protein